MINKTQFQVAFNVCFTCIHHINSFISNGAPVFLWKALKNTTISVMIDRHRELQMKIEIRQFQLLCCIKCVTGEWIQFQEGKKTNWTNTKLAMWLQKPTLVTRTDIGTTNRYQYWEPWVEPLPRFPLGTVTYSQELVVSRTNPLLAVTANHYTLYY